MRYFSCHYFPAEPIWNVVENHLFSWEDSFSYNSCHILIDLVESAQSLQYKTGKFITLSKARMNALTLETKFTYILPPLPLLEEQTLTESGTSQFSI